MGIFSGGTEIINNGELLEGGIPTATIVPWSSASVPSGFLECNGAAVSRTTYSALFAIVGTTYGAGDGSTTFNVPDLADNVPVGKSNNKALASTGGANTVTNSGNVGTNTNTNINVTGNVAGSTANATLSVAQLASHNHQIETPISANPNSQSQGVQVSATRIAQLTLADVNQNTGSGSGHSHNMSANFSGSGNASSTSTSNFTGSANSVLQPYLTVIYIIKT